MKAINFKIMFDRVRYYISIIQFAMIGYLFIISTEFNLVTTLLAVGIASAVLAVIDFKWIYPAELRRASEKNPMFMELYKNQKELLEIMTGKAKVKKRVSATKG